MKPPNLLLCTLALAVFGGPWSLSAIAQFPTVSTSVAPTLVEQVNTLTASTNASFSSSAEQSDPDGAPGLSAGGLDLTPDLPGIPLNVSSPLTFNFTKGAGILAMEAGSPAQQAQAANVVAGFNAAANLWREAFVDPITINLTIDYQALGFGILGSTSTATVGATYSNARLGLIADATSANDATATTSLLNTPALTFFTNDRAGVKILDNNASANNTVLDVARANAKAIGLIAPNDAASDGSVTFSSNFAFDFNRGDGINGAQFDFVGVAAHEIGHLMGFISGIDDIDFFTGAGPNAGADLNGGTAGIGTLDPFRIFSVLDLYRYSAQSVGAGAGVLDLATGGTPFFSIDAGATSLGGFSTGSYNGDGRQASHWKDNLALGLMDPTLSNGELALITALDLRALDVIGYDYAPAPEPGTAIFGVLMVLAGAVTRKRRRR